MKIFVGLEGVSQAPLGESKDKESTTNPPALFSLIFLFLQVFSLRFQNTSLLTFFLQRTWLIWFM